MSPLQDSIPVATAPYDIHTAPSGSSPDSEPALCRHPRNIHGPQYLGVASCFFGTSQPFDSLQGSGGPSGTYGAPCFRQLYLTKESAMKTHQKFFVQDFSFAAATASAVIVTRLRLRHSTVTSPLIRASRSDAMGETRITTGLYDENFFNNPARVTANPRFRFTIVDFAAEGNSDLPPRSRA